MVISRLFYGLSTISLALLTSCSNYELDTSLTSKIHKWAPGSDDSQARISLRSATHRAALEKEKADFHEKDLIYALQNTKDIEAQKFFIHELKLIGTEQSIDPLSQFLKQDELTTDAIMALLSINEAGYDVSDALNAALPNTQGETQIALIKALGSIQSDDSIEQLENLMFSQDSALALSAIRSVANIADEDSSPKLLKTIDNFESFQQSKVIHWNFLYAQNLANEASQDAETHALEVLSRIDKNTQTHLYISGLQTLYKIKGNDFSQDLIRYINDKNHRIAEGASRLLTNSIDSSVNDLLVAAFPKSGEFFQELALKVITTRGDANSSLLIARSLKSPSQKVRLAACNLSIKVKESMVVPGLIELVRSGTDLDQKSAVKALKRIPSDKSSAAIREAYTSSAFAAQAKLLQILSTKSDSQNAALALKETLSQDKKVSKAAFSALKNIAEFQQLPQLLVMTKSAKTSSLIRGYQNALVTASYGKAEECSKAILAEISSGASSKVNLALIQVLGRVGSQTAFNGLKKLYEDGAETVQKEAIRTLAKWQDIKNLNDLLKIAKASQGTNIILMSRGLSSTISSSTLKLEDKKKYLKKIIDFSDSQEKKRLNEMLKKLR
ncbi:MAG: HEAT repeat domain-containing protein [Lentisphaerales bacterium]|nr:HEAT repeat domain-containing protein [Lentisphaerales bacterium]